MTQILRCLLALVFLIGGRVMKGNADGNGNVVALVSAADGSVAAQYEYGPFGELLRATGPMARANPFLFSTKYYDWETGLYYYGVRYYNPGTVQNLYAPTIARRVPMNSDAGTASHLRTPLKTKESSATSDSTAKRLARLVALSRLTREGPGRLFHSVPSGPNVGNGCDCPSYVG